LVSTIWWGVFAVAPLPLLQLVHWWCLVAILVAILADLFVVRLLELLCRTQGPYQVSTIMLAASCWCSPCFGNFLPFVGVICRTGASFSNLVSLFWPEHLAPLWPAPELLAPSWCLHFLDNNVVAVATGHLVSQLALLVQ
jgi:hypothetical protein